MSKTHFFKPIGGIDQILGEGAYRLASGFYCYSYVSGSQTKVLVSLDPECRLRVGEAHTDAYIWGLGVWRWFNASVSESGVCGTGGPALELVADMYGRLQPPVPAPDRAASPLGSIDGLEQIEATGTYCLARRFFAICSIKADEVGVTVTTLDGRLIGIANKRGLLWSWRTSLGDGAGGHVALKRSEDLIKVDGHLLPPIDTPQWSAAPPNGMTSMMVTERERAAILAFRGNSSAPL